MSVLKILKYSLRNYLPIRYIELNGRIEAEWTEQTKCLKGALEIKSLNPGQGCEDPFYISFRLKYRPLND